MFTIVFKRPYLDKGIDYKILINGSEVMMLPPGRTESLDVVAMPVFVKAKYLWLGSPVVRVTSDTVFMISRTDVLARPSGLIFFVCFLLMIFRHLLEDGIIRESLSVVPSIGIAATFVYSFIIRRSDWLQVKVLPAVMPSAQETNVS